MCDPIDGLLNGGLSHPRQSSGSPRKADHQAGLIGSFLKRERYVGDRSDRSVARYCHSQYRYHLLMRRAFAFKGESLSAERDR